MLKRNIVCLFLSQVVQWSQLIVFSLGNRADGTLSLNDWYCNSQNPLKFVDWATLFSICKTLLQTNKKINTDEIKPFQNVYKSFIKRKRINVWMKWFIYREKNSMSVGYTNKVSNRRFIVHPFSFHYVICLRICNFCKHKNATHCCMIRRFIFSFAWNNRDYPYWKKDWLKQDTFDWLQRYEIK